MDPPRLSREAGSDVERRLAALVIASQSDVGSSQQIAALEARLLPLIGPAVPVAPSVPAAKVAGAGKAATLGGAGAVKLAAAGAIVVAAAAAYLGARGSGGTKVTPTAPAQQVAPPTPTEPAASIAPQEPSPPEPAPAPEVVGSAPAISAPAASHERAVSEGDLIGQAQAALTGSPARALSLCEQHRRLYPHGVLVQEREVLAIEALQRLGRHTQAVARGERFLKAFPGSAHQSKIAAIVGSR
jgi:hypothetical protein